MEEESIKGMDVDEFRYRQMGGLITHLQEVRNIIFNLKKKLSYEDHKDFVSKLTAEIAVLDGAITSLEIYEDEGKMDWSYKEE